MLSVPYYTYTYRPAPPVNLSQSLEGLEQVIPPTSPFSLAGRPYYLQLDKPLPEKPLPHTPSSSMGYSNSPTACRNSNETSTLDSGSRYSGRQSSRYSADRDSYPIFVREGSDYEVERPYSDGSGVVGKEGGLMSPSVPAPLAAARPSPATVGAFLASDDEEEEEEDMEEWMDDDDYNDYHLDERWSEIRHTVTDWSQGRHGQNHYFREKKWDFFPELDPTAGMSSMSNAGPNTNSNTCRPPSTRQSKSFKKRNTAAFDFRRRNDRARANTFTVAGSSMANVRDSIRSVVHKTLKSSALEKEKEKRRRQPRPSTAQRAAASTSGSDSSSKQPPHNNNLRVPHEENVSISSRLRSPSMSTGSSATMGIPRSAPPPSYPKQLAVPLSPYQKYGAAIFEKSTPATTTGSQTPNRYYQTQKQTRRWSLSGFSTSSSYTSSYLTNSNNSAPQLLASQSYPGLPISPPLRSQLQRGTKALQDGTRSMRGALDGAKSKVVDARMERKRAQLKAQIRLIGPVNPYTTYGRVDAWDCI